MTVSTLQIYIDDEDVKIKQETDDSTASLLTETDYFHLNTNVCKPEKLKIKIEPSHLRIKHKSLPSSPPKVKIISNVKISNLRSYTCANCDRIFWKRRYILRHMRIHTGEKPYKCPFCNKAFCHDHSRLRHLKIHTGERPFVCTVCDKDFISNNELKRHILIHTGEKPFTCRHCGKAFNRLSNLNSHMKIHFCLRPFKCKYCGKAFRESRYLKRHLKITNDEKPVKCTVCYSLLFSNACSNYHSNIHAVDKFLCDYCDRIFSHKDEVRKHIHDHINKMNVKSTTNV